MRRINIALALLLAVLVVNMSPVFAQDFQAVISYEVGIDAKSFMPGEPVSIRLLVSNPKAMNAYYHNLAYGKEEEKVSTITLGDKKTPWTNLANFALLDNQGKKAGVKFSAQSAAENAVTLGTDNFAQNYFFLAGEETAKLRPGDYTIKVSLKDVAGNDLGLKIIEKKELTGKESIPHLFKFGCYYLLTEQFEKAEEYANKILAIDPHFLWGLNLLGDAQTGLEKYEEAYQTFNRAIDEYFIQNPPDGTGRYEGPEIFSDKAQDLKNKLME